MQVLQSLFLSSTIVAVFTVFYNHVILSRTGGELLTSTNLHVGAFCSYIPRIEIDLKGMHDSIPTFWNQNRSSLQRLEKSNYQNKNHISISLESTVLSSWLRDTLQSLGLDFTQEKMEIQSFSNSSPRNENNDQKKTYGRVIRTGSRAFDSNSSKPSSDRYTTKKDSQSFIHIQPEGVVGDYNHYRTNALDSTPDRALSIVTTDVLKNLQSAGWDMVGEGDLGENVYIDDIDHTFFEVGKRYTFKNPNSDDKSEIGEDLKEGGVIIEITERIEPCGNLCKLPYINNEKFEPMERFENCKKFLLQLDEKDGLRGWYAKVIGEGGIVKIGDQISSLDGIDVTNV